MRIFEVVNHYNNWIRYNSQSLLDDFNEYKGKEFIKWQARAKSHGFRFPIFDTIEDFKHALDTAKIVNIDDIGFISNQTHNDSLASIKSMVSTYANTFAKPRDVDRIVNGFRSNVQMPMPIVLKGKNGQYSMAGNTRQSTARVLGITCKALLVNVSI